MKLLLVDDDNNVRENMEKFLKDLSLGCEIESCHFDNTDRNEEAIQKQITSLRGDDFLLIDLFLGGQSESRTPYSDLKSVKMVSKMKIPNSHIVFYSNGNEREPEPLFKIVPKCHYLPLTAAALDESDENGYKKFRNRRENIAEKIRRILSISS